jgi:hypothetical protein
MVKKFLRETCFMSPPVFVRIWRACGSAFFIYGPFANCHSSDTDLRHNRKSAPLIRSIYFGSQAFEPSYEK